MIGQNLKQRDHASAKLPAIVAILKVEDFGPVEDPESAAHCPHCGSVGRYMNTFLCEDGSIRGAMSHCVTLYPIANARAAKLVQEAFKRQRDLKPGKKLAGWWQNMIDAADLFQSDINKIGFNRDRLNQFYVEVLGCEQARQSWLKRNGYGKRRWAA